MLAMAVLSMPIAIGSSLRGAVCPRNAENRPNQLLGIRRANLAPTHPHLRSCRDWRSAATLTTTMRNLRKRKCTSPGGGTRARRDGLQRGEGLGGAIGPSHKTNAVLRTRFPVSRKKLASASRGSQGVAKLLLMSW